jgi:amidophosphoribosyltransferase
MAELSPQRQEILPGHSRCSSHPCGALVAPDRPQEQCAVVAVLGTRDAASLAVIALGELQHRGQDASGMALAPAPGVAPNMIKHIRGLGMVSQVYAGKVEKLAADGYPFVIGHNRYQTAGDRGIQNVHPHKLNIPGLGPVYLAHNGNLSNAAQLRQKLLQSGAKFKSTVDTELILHLMAVEVKALTPTQRRDQNLALRILQNALAHVEGSYSLVLLLRDRAFAVRDPHGFRPLSLGGDTSAGLIVASESCVFDRLQVDRVRDIKPGEILQILLQPDGRCGAVSSHQLELQKPTSLCSLEYPYFARPTSRFPNPGSPDGPRYILEVRRELGARTCEEIRQHLDLEGLVVCPIPDSGRHAAEGLARRLGVHPVAGLIRNHFEGRSFLLSNDGDRLRAAKAKRMVFPPDIRGRHVLLVDDSVVRGNTLRATVEDLLEAGALDVSAAVTAPQITRGCPYGIDLSERASLIANQYPDLAAMARHLKLRKIFFLSLAAFKEIIGPGHCYACFDGNFPTSVEGLQV